MKTGERLWWVGGIGYAPKGVPVLGRELVYVSAPGGDAPVFPPFEEGLKQFDSNGDQRVQLEETRSDPYIHEHFGWMIQTATASSSAANTNTFGTPAARAMV